MADSERQDALKEADPDVDGRVGQDPFPLGDCTIRSERSCTVGKEQAESEKVVPTEYTLMLTDQEGDKPDNVVDRRGEFDCRPVKHGVKHGVLPGSVTRIGSGVEMHG